MGKPILAGSWQAGRCHRGRRPKHGVIGVSRALGWPRYFSQPPTVERHDVVQQHSNGGSRLAAAPKCDDLGTRNAGTAVSAAQCFRISEIVGLGHHIDDPGDRYSIVTGRAIAHPVSCAPLTRRVPSAQRIQRELLKLGHRW